MLWKKLVPTVIKDSDPVRAVGNFFKTADGQLCHNMRHTWHTNAGICSMSGKTYVVTMTKCIKISMEKFNNSHLWPRLPHPTLPLVYSFHYRPSGILQYHILLNMHVTDLKSS